MERKLYFFIAVTFTIAITIGSLIPVTNVIELPSVKFIDKILHFTAYFTLTVSWLFAYYKSLKLYNKGFLIAIVLFVYGIIIEVLQGVLTTYRQADLLDIIANLIGIVTAWVFFNKIYHKNRMK
ncbi:MAG: VanZ family protein [Lutibacter sp.]